MTKVFVYGSLKRGFGNHHLLGRARFLGCAITKPEYMMVSLGSYPGVIDAGCTSIRGELYEVDDETLLCLDRLEGHPHMYQREEVLVLNEAKDEHHLAKMYVYQRVPGNIVVVPSGEWRRGCVQR